MSAAEYIGHQQAAYRQSKPIKVVHRDTAKARAAPVQNLKKQRTKRKKSAFLSSALAPPQYPGVALAVAAILVLTGAGWLLGERPQPI